MRYVVFSDVQGEAKKLETALHDTALLKKDAYVCLGDIVAERDFGLTNHAIELVRNTAKIAVAGNHDHKVIDRYASKVSPENLNYLKGLPEIATESGIVFYHSSLQETDLRLNHDGDFEIEFEKIAELYPAAWLAIHGHTHQQVLMESRPVTDRPKPRMRSLEISGKHTLERGVTYIANPGGIGLLFGEPTGLMVVDSDTRTVQFYSSEELRLRATHATFAQMFAERWFPLLRDYKLTDLGKVAAEDAARIDAHPDLSPYNYISNFLRQARGIWTWRPTGDRMRASMRAYARDLASIVSATVGNISEDFDVIDPKTLVQQSDANNWRAPTIHTTNEWNSSELLDSKEK